MHPKFVAQYSNEKRGSKSSKAYVHDDFEVICACCKWHENLRVLIFRLGANRKRKLANFAKNYTLMEKKPKKILR